MQLATHIKRTKWRWLCKPTHALIPALSAHATGLDRTPAQGPCKPCAPRSRGYIDTSVTRHGFHTQSARGAAPTEMFAAQAEERDRRRPLTRAVVVHKQHAALADRAVVGALSCVSLDGRDAAAAACCVLCKEPRRFRKHTSGFGPSHLRHRLTRSGICCCCSPPPTTGDMPFIMAFPPAAGER